MEKMFRYITLLFMRLSAYNDLQLVRCISMEENTNNTSTQRTPKNMISWTPGTFTYKNSTLDINEIIADKPLSSYLWLFQLGHNVMWWLKMADIDRMSSDFVTLAIINELLKTLMDVINPLFTFFPLWFSLIWIQKETLEVMAMHCSPHTLL